MKNFSHFNKPISDCTDKELIDWYISLLNGGVPPEEDDLKAFEEFRAEVANRNNDFQNKIAYIDSVL